MEAEGEGKFTYQQIYSYIKHGKYPETVQKDDKLALWKQSKFFQAQEMHLYRSITSKNSEGSMTFGDRLAINYDINLHPFLLTRKDNFCNTEACD